ncbi:MAG: peptidase U32 [Deltaproteobacteria bacterium]|nr:peptidase U32 [Deltaproteobacteria bacterium]MBU54188.1 peptidase U32 [Deltaproteobacteria bacterium]|tara:strand:+ start:12846 stop:15347 length:2502 start_codon:yes stop_codon:yes gene_type:complete
MTTSTSETQHHSPQHATRPPELLAPAGNWDCARAAVAAGADAIYFGLQMLNARMRANNFTLEDLPALMRYLHSHGVRGFVTMNTLVFPNELAQAETQLRALEDAGVDAVIVQDLGFAWLMREVAPSIELHASTQMTITSPEGLAFLDGVLKLDQAVLARELSIKELQKFDPSTSSVPLEVFVHGALCVAYSGQCLTSESLGQRSANRGECAQACRMPYQLIVDGELKELGEQRYLLSPQDLAAIDVIEPLIQSGIRTFKIEGRLKSPEYVTAVTRVYRKALDAAAEGLHVTDVIKQEDRYALEMTFSRGLTTGWLEGTNHPKLTHGRFGKKRGVYLGEISEVGHQWVRLTRAKGAQLKQDDGVVFDAGEERDQEQGGRIWRVEGDKLYFHRRSKLRWKRIKVGQKLWKTDDPALNTALQEAWKTFPKDIPGQPLDIQVEGRQGQPLVLRCQGVNVESQQPLEAAQKHPLTTETLRKQLGRLGGTEYALGALDNQLEGEVMMPLSALNRLRRALITALEDTKQQQQTQQNTTPLQYTQLLPQKTTPQETTERSLRVLCRTMEQLEVALAEDLDLIYLDFEAIKRYKDAMQFVRQQPKAPPIIVATPRIQKAGEAGFFKVIQKAQPDGVLIRNLGAIHFFQESDDIQLIGDFSLNVANPLTARLLMEHTPLSHLTLSCDLNVAQTIDVLEAAPPEWFELILHQHMPMFHMEHCVFCTFLSNGTSVKDCGRPCDTHTVQLRDRVGQLHPLHADVGCRNTLFNGRAQTGARFYEKIAQTGLQRYRVELLNESAKEALQCIRAYKQLLSGNTDGQQLWTQLGAAEQLGVTEGTLTVLS